MLHERSSFDTPLQADLAVIKQVRKGTCTHSKQGNVALSLAVTLLMLQLPLGDTQQQA